MAYIGQEKKAKIAPKVKAVLKKYNLRGSLSIRNHMALVLTVTAGPIDFIGNLNDTMSKLHRVKEYTPAKDSIQVNPYWYQEHFTGLALEFLKEVIPAMNDGNHDNSDIQTDYFDVGWYVDINIGRWNKPYELV